MRGELGIVIGKRTRNVSVQDAGHCIDGIYMRK